MTGLTPRQMAEVLGKAELFAGLAESERVRLAGFCVPRALGKRQYLFHEGQPGEAIFILVSGGLQLVKTSDDGKDVVIRTLEPGDLFAEVVLFERETYPVSAVAVRKSVALRLAARDVRHLMAEEGFRNRFVASLMRRLRYLADRILVLSVYDIEERFFRFLAEQYGRKTEYVVALPRKDIAAAIGATPETLSRLVRRLTKSGKISWKGRVLRVKR